MQFADQARFRDLIITAHPENTFCAYIVTGSRSCKYGLVRSEPKPDHLFVVNLNPNRNLISAGTVIRGVS
jgi:hypothetical protein